ncbi:MAG: hypothetical protein DME17_00020 [Candidatus Rokuibacteriota bacterium]|nr:MAG: hypothetical protein DME17_00020 [Candidatus Rokubacteria bacterium]
MVDSRQRLDGLLDEPRPGTPRGIGDADVERVMRLTLETTTGAPSRGYSISMNRGSRRARSSASSTVGIGPKNSGRSSIEAGIELVFDRDGNPAGILLRGARIASGER